MEGCERCGDTGWLVRHYYVCGCRAGDYAWAKWEGMSIEEYDRRAAQSAALPSSVGADGEQEA